MLLSNQKQIQSWVSGDFTHIDYCSRHTGAAGMGKELTEIGRGGRYDSEMCRDLEDQSKKGFFFYRDE